MIPQWNRESRNPSSSSSALFSKHKFQQRISTFLGRVSTEEKEVFEWVPCSVSSLYLIHSVFPSYVLHRNALQIRSASRTYAQCFPLSTFCHVTALFQNGSGFFFSKFNASHNSLSWQWKTFGRFFFFIIQIKSKDHEKSHISYSEPLLNTLTLSYFFFLGMMPQVTTPFFWQFPPFASLSSLNLHPVGRETLAHNHFQRCSIKFWLGSIWLSVFNVFKTPLLYIGWLLTFAVLLKDTFRQNPAGLPYLALCWGVICIWPPYH